MLRFSSLLFAFVFSLFTYTAKGVEPSCRIAVAGIPIELPQFVVAELSDRSIFVPVDDTGSPVPVWVEKHLEGGKHLRPMMAFLTAGALDTNVTQVRGLTRLLELIHLGSLFMDDIIDGSTERRNRPALHVEEGFVGGLVAGPWLQAHVFEEAATLTNRTVQTRISKTLKMMGNSEILQNALRARGESGGIYSEEEYFTVANGKTGALFGLSFAIVPLHLQKDPAFCEKWYELGYGIGVAYQIKDDFEDAEKEATEINYALLKASQHFGGSPFRQISRSDLATIQQREISNMDHRKRRLLGILRELEKETPQPQSQIQRAAFETIRDIISYVTAI